MARSVATCAFFFDAEPLGEAERHELDACALCTKPLTRNSDIFMYKGDTPFCSEECRYEQMHHDAACARQQASASRQNQLGRHEAAAAASVVAAPAVSAPVSRKADVSVAS